MHNTLKLTVKLEHKWSTFMSSRIAQLKKGDGICSQF